MMLCLAVALCACNKDKTSDTEMNNAQNNASIERLRSFRKQIEFVRANPGIKSDETLSLTEALWDVENHFNLTFSDVESYYDEVNNHEFTLTLPVEQQQVLVYDAVALYEEVINQARAALQSDEFEDKGFISLTVKEVNCENRCTSVTFSGKTGNRTNCNIDPLDCYLGGPFHADDNWMYASPMGKCDDPDIPSGADEQLQERLYARLIEPFTKTEPAYRNIYTDRMVFIFDGTNYPGIFYNEGLDNLCIDYIRMNNHFLSEKKVITQTIPEQYYLTGFSPISISINGIMTDDWNAVTHRNEIVYGIRSKVRIDEFGTIESLIL